MPRTPIDLEEALYGVTPPAAPETPTPSPPRLAEAARLLLAKLDRCETRPGGWHSVGRWTMAPELCPQCATRAALAAEEALDKIRREAAEALLTDAAAVFGSFDVQSAVITWATMETSR